MRTMLNLAGRKDDLDNFALVSGLPMGNITITEEFSIRGYDMHHDQLLYFSPKIRIAPAFLGFLT